MTYNTIENSNLIPEETIIYYSKNSIYLKLFMSVGLVIFSVYLMFSKSYFSSFLFISVGIYILYFDIKKIKDNKPKIVLNKFGIQRPPNILHEWSSIKIIEIRNEINGNSDYIERELYYETVFGQIIRFNIDDYSVSKVEMERLINYYRFGNNNEPPTKNWH